MPTHWGFADISCFLSVTGDPRPSAVTFGVAADGKDAPAVWSAVQQSWTVATGIKKVIGANVVMNRIRVSYGTEDEADLVYDMPTSVGCVGSGQNLPANCALLVHKRTQKGGQRGRGRFFLPWSVNESDCGENGIINSTAVATANTALNVWYMDLATRGVPMYLLHQPGQSPTGLPTQVTSLAVDPLISTQRRRLRR